MRFAGTQLANYIGTMDYSGMGAESQKGRSMERRATMEGEGMVANAGVQSLGKVQSAEFQADAIEAQGQAQAQASRASGMASMVSGLAGGIGGMFGGGGGGGGGGYVTPGGISTGMDASHFAPTQLGVNHFNLSTGIPGVNR